MERRQRSVLMDEVKTYLPSRLRSVPTRITSLGGCQVLEKKESEGKYTSRVIGDGLMGYVGDYSPDRHAGLVLPGLLVGAQDFAHDLGLLRSFGVSHILNVATGVPNYFQQEITYKRLEIRDWPDTNIRKHFEECFQFIDEGRRHGWVFVHCNAGISRAATIVIAYVMSREKMRLDAAMAKVRSARPIISPNRGFLQQLRDYDRELFGIENCDRHSRSTI